MAKSATAAGFADDSFAGRLKSFPQRTKSFYTEVRTEMKKVTTPTRKEVQATTVVVIVTVFLFGAYFWIVDTVLDRSMGNLLRYLTHR
jgi:preprotein translocase subunit SecE